MLKRCVAEAVGTFGLVFAGTGAIMVASLSGGELGQVGVGLSFGLAVAAMIYATGHISGAHINPAVTLGLVLCRRLPIRELPAYWAFQLGGAALASLVLRGLLGSVADMGATLPSGTQWESLGMEVLLTFFLVLVVMAVVTHARAIGPAAPLAIGATVGLEAMFAGPISGASMNPARSFGPRPGRMGMGQPLGLLGRTTPGSGGCVRALRVDPGPGGRPDLPGYPQEGGVRPLMGQASLRRQREACPMGTIPDRSV